MKEFCDTILCKYVFVVADIKFIAFFSDVSWIDVMGIEGIGKRIGMEVYIVVFFLFLSVFLLVFFLYVSMVGIGGGERERERVAGVLPPCLRFLVFVGFLLPPSTVSNENSISGVIIVLDMGTGAISRSLNSLRRDEGRSNINSDVSAGFFCDIADIIAFDFEERVSKSSNRCSLYVTGSPVFVSQDGKGLFGTIFFTT